MRTRADKRDTRIDLMAVIGNASEHLLCIRHVLRLAHDFLALSNHRIRPDDNAIPCLRCCDFLCLLSG